MKIKLKKSRDGQFYLRVTFSNGEKFFHTEDYKSHSYTKKLGLRTAKETGWKFVDSTKKQ